MLGAPTKRIGFIGSSRKDLQALPEHVRRAFGRLLLDVQFGETPQSARAFGEGVLRVMKLIEDYDGETFRALHGIATSRRDIELVRNRLRQARQLYRAEYETKER